VSTITLLNYSISRGYIASVHRTGCGDIRCDTDERAAIAQQYPTLAEALADFIDGEMAEMGYSVADVHVYPCVRKAAEAATPGELLDEAIGRQSGRHPDQAPRHKLI
jgi:hypothetical protein